MRWHVCKLGPMEVSRDTVCPRDTWKLQLFQQLHILVSPIFSDLSPHSPNKTLRSCLHLPHCFSFHQEIRFPRDAITNLSLPSLIPSHFSPLSFLSFILPCYLFSNSRWSHFNSNNKLSCPRWRQEETNARQAEEQLNQIPATVYCSLLSGWPERHLGCQLLPWIFLYFEPAEYSVSQVRCKKLLTALIR